MIIEFVLSKAFKSADSQALFSEYLKRITHFSRCSFSVRKNEIKREKGERVWLCDRLPGSKMLSSEELAAHLKKTHEGAARKLSIVIGGPDGFTQEEREAWAPDLRWSFGALTLPHELAAVVAAEQIYRGWAILNRLPYHGGH